MFICEPGILYFEGLEIGLVGRDFVKNKLILYFLPVLCYFQDFQQKILLSNKKFMCVLPRVIMTGAYILSHDLVQYW